MAIAGILAGTAKALAVGTAKGSKIQKARKIFTIAKGMKGKGGSEGEGTPGAIVKAQPLIPKSVGAPPPPPKSEIIKVEGSNPLADSIRMVQVSVQDLGSTMKDFVAFRVKNKAEKQKAKTIAARSFAERFKSLKEGFDKGMGVAKDKIPFFDRLMTFVKAVVGGALILYLVENLGRFLQWTVDTVYPLVIQMAPYVGLGGQVSNLEKQMEDLQRTVDDLNRVTGTVPPQQQAPGGYAPPGEPQTVNGQALTGSSVERAVTLIKGKEGFREMPYWDVNAYRAGYGSDTYTTASGEVRQVRQGERVSREDAERDIQRRTRNFMNTARKQVGASLFDSLPADTQAALTSIAYNYGSLPDRLVRAIKKSGGDLEQIARGVEGLKADDRGVNAGRRQSEANIIRGSGSPLPPQQQPPQSALPPLPPTNTIQGKQHYGASRDGGRRQHAGVDFDAGPNDTFYSRIGGTVIYSGNAGGGYGNVVDVYNKELGVTERIAEGDVRLVKKGDVIAPGTPVQKGTHQTGVFHYEIRKGKAGASGSYEGTLNPTEFLKRMDTARPQPRKPPSEVPSSVSATPSYQRVAVAAPVEQPPSTPIVIGGGGQQMVASGPSRRDLTNRSSQVRFNSRLWSA